MENKGRQKRVGIFRMSRSSSLIMRFYLERNTTVLCEIYKQLLAPEEITVMEVWVIELPVGGKVRGPIQNYFLTH